MNRNAAIVLLILVVVAAAAGAFFLFRARKKSSKPEDDLLIVPRPMGGYTVRPATEAFTGAGRKERMTSNPSSVPPTDDEWPDYIWIERDTTLLEQELRRTTGEFTCDDNPGACQKVNYRTNNEEVLWLLTKLYDEVNEASLDYLRSLPESLSSHLNHRVINEDPLTFRVFNEGHPPVDIIPGVTYNAPLFSLYTAILFAYKGEGRRLPRPDPNVDYTF